MSKKKPVIGGAVVPLVTPVDSSGGIDYKALEKLIGWLLEKGIDGLFVAGTTGRFSYFTPAENMKLCHAVSRMAGKKVTIYGGCCDSGLRRALNNAENMAKAGADIAVTTGPYYLSCSIEEAEADLVKFADKSPLPVIFYNLPEFVGYGLRPEWLGEIARHPNVAGYKDSSNDIEHHLDVLNRTKGTDFKVLMGKEHLLSRAFRAGASGLVISFINAFPEPFVEMVRHARENDWEAVDRCQATASAIIDEFMLKRKSQYFSALMLYLEGELNRQGIRIKLY